MAAVALALLGVIAAVAPARSDPQSTVATFDGNRPVVISPAGSDQTKGQDVVSLEFWISVNATAAILPTTAIVLSAPDQTLSISVADDRKSLIFGSSVTGHVAQSLPVDLTTPAMVHVGVNFGGVDSTVFLDVGAGKTVSKITFAPDDDSPVTLSLGGPGFSGAIGAARLWRRALNPAQMAVSQTDADNPSPGGADVIQYLVIGQVDGGLLARPAVPAIGLWHGNGMATTISVPKRLDGIPDANHGQFQDDEPFLSVFDSDKSFAEFGVAFASDMSSVLYLRRNGRGLGLYDVLDETGHPSGLVKFRPSGTFFDVQDIKGGMPLKRGEAYKTLQVPLDGDQFQQYGEAWQVNDKPKNFDHSVMGCYDSQTLNAFDLQEHGCSRRFFREPPAGSHRFDTGRNNLTIPWGWKYVNISETRSRSYSAMASSSADVGNSMVGGSGYNFAIGIVNYQHNTTVTDERDNVVSSKRMRAYHNFVARRHSVVVDAKKMMLDQCFLRDVARTAFELTGKVPAMPAYFDDADTDGGECDALLDDGLDVDTFTNRYADHYAYAITYGARAVERINMTANVVANNVKSGTDVSESLDAELKGSAGYGGIQANFADGGGFSNKTDTSNWSKSEGAGEVTFNDLICVGGNNCSGSSVDVGDNPVPIYLDMRPTSDLLGPPYFADPAITVTLRRAVDASYATKVLPPPPDIPFVRIFDVGLSRIACGTQPMTNKSQLTFQQQVGLGPFVAGRRFGSLKTSIPTTTPRINTIALAQAAYQRACPSQLASDGDRIDFVTETPASPDVAGQVHISVLPGNPLSPTISDLLAGKTTRIMVPMFDAAMGGGAATHPGLYARLRTWDDANAGKEDCTAPCAFGFQDSKSHDEFVSVDPNAPNPDPDPDFVLYPSFEGIDLATVPTGGTTTQHVLGRGASNVRGVAAPVLAYWAVGTVTLTEVPDIAGMIGY